MGMRMSWMRMRRRRSNIFADTRRRDVMGQRQVRGAKDNIGGSATAQAGCTPALSSHQPKLTNTNCDTRPRLVGLAGLVGLVWVWLGWLVGLWLDGWRR